MLMQWPQREASPRLTSTAGWSSLDVGPATWGSDNNAYAPEKSRLRGGERKAKQGIDD